MADNTSNVANTGSTLPTTGAAPGGGGSGGTSIGGSTVGLTAPTLPPQYSSGNTGFFTRQTEAVPTAVTVGPDGAIYVSELNGIPYPTGYASILRIDGTNTTTGYDGEVSSGVPQVWASGFSQINGLAFNNSTGDAFVLEYVNSNEIYDPTIAPATLPPSLLIQVKPDGARSTISGPELRLGNYVLVNQETGDVYVAINNQGPATATSPGTGEVLSYKQNPATGTWSSTVIASGLNSPRGMSIGPDGNLYVLEQGTGTPNGAPGADTAPVIPFIPGLVSERGGNTGSITRVDVTNPAGGQQTVLTGLASFREFNPTTGQDRVISIGMNGLTITPDGTAYIAAGGGLAPETAVAIGPLGEQLQGVLKVDGLFGSNPSQATVTPQFNSLQYASKNGPDGATTLYNTESNLNDIVYNPADKKLYAVDAARNDLYGLTNDGSTVDSVTVFQKQPPVLTPPQYGAVTQYGGNPTQQYAAAIGSYTTKNPTSSVPDVPGNVPPEGLAAAAAAAGLIPPGPATVDGSSAVPTGTTAPSTSVAPRGEDATGSGVTGSIGTGSSSSGAPPSGLFSTDLPTLPAGASFAPALPGATDPVSPPVLASNVYANYYNPFFGNYAPAASNPLKLSDGQGGTYAASHLYVFGDRLADDGNAASLASSLGQKTNLASAPYNSNGGFTDGPKWTTDLAQYLGLTAPTQSSNYAYVNATARPQLNPLDPNQSKTLLSSFEGQIQAFKQSGQTFSSNDVVSLTFGGNDVASASGLPSAGDVSASVYNIAIGMQELGDLGAKHFLVSNVADVTLAPIFNDPGFQQALGATPATFKGLVDQFNAKLTFALAQFGADNPDSDVNVLDLHKLFNGIAADPAAYGFTNVAQPVLATPPGSTLEPVYNPAIVGQDPAVQHSTLFLDPFFDPTALGQTLIAQTARNALTV